MINGKTVEEYNAWQRQRGVHSFQVARLRGDGRGRQRGIPESRLPGTDRRGSTGTREEEAADLVVAAEVRGKETQGRYRKGIDRTQIAAAKAKGFRDCNEVFRATRHP